MVNIVNFKIDLIMEPMINVFENKQQVAKRFADYFIEIVRQKDDDFFVCLSGGSTPKLFFQELANNYSGAADWNKIHFFWGDERCVPPDDAQSNYGMTNENLFIPLKIEQKNIHRIRGEKSPFVESSRYGEELMHYVPKNFGFPRFDFVILGLGEDGHTASIFPDQLHLLISGRLCEVATHPESGQKRITLTATVLNNAENIAFLATGEAKAEKISEIINQKKDFQHYPASHIRPIDGTLQWFIDKEAAKQIE
jgi:6-phosphogluconolactonase